MAEIRSLDSLDIDSIVASDSVSTSVSQSLSLSESMSESMVHSTSINSVPQTIPAKTGKQLPNTGESASVYSALLGAVAGLTGLGLVTKRRKNDNEE